MKKEVLRAGASVQDRVIAWFLTGATGVSAFSIVAHMTGNATEFRREEGIHHPLDRGDFIRCELLLQAIPEFRPRLAEMGFYSWQWKRLIRNWERMAASSEVADAEFRALCDEESAREARTRQRRHARSMAKIKARVASPS